MKKGDKRAYAKLIGPGWQYYMTKPLITLGRGGKGVECDVKLTDENAVSRRHFSIRFAPEHEAVEVENLSKNGILVNGYFLQQYGQPMLLKSQTEIAYGRFDSMRLTVILPHISEQYYHTSGYHQSIPVPTAVTGAAPSTSTMTGSGATWIVKRRHCHLVLCVDWIGEVLLQAKDMSMSINDILEKLRGLHDHLRSKTRISDLNLLFSVRHAVTKNEMLFQIVLPHSKNNSTDAVMVTIHPGALHRFTTYARSAHATRRQQAAKDRANQQLQQQQEEHQQQQQRSRKNDSNATVPAASAAASAAAQAKIEAAAAAKKKKEQDEEQEQRKRKRKRDEIQEPTPPTVTPTAPTTTTTAAISTSTVSTAATATTTTGVETAERENKQARVTHAQQQPKQQQLVRAQQQQQDYQRQLLQAASARRPPHPSHSQPPPGGWVSPQHTRPQQPQPLPHTAAAAATPLSSSSAPSSVPVGPAAPSSSSATPPAAVPAFIPGGSASVQQQQQQKQALFASTPSSTTATPSPLVSAPMTPYIFVKPPPAPAPTTATTAATLTTNAPVPPAAAAVPPATAWAPAAQMARPQQQPQQQHVVHRPQQHGNQTRPAQNKNKTTPVTVQQPPLKGRHITTHVAIAAPTPAPAAAQHAPTNLVSAVAHARPAGVLAAKPVTVTPTGAAVPATAARLHASATASAALVRPPAPGAVPVRPPAAAAAVVSAAAAKLTAVASNNNITAAANAARAAVGIHRHVRQQHQQPARNSTTNALSAVNVQPAATTPVTMSTALKVMPASTQQQQKGSSIVLDVGKPKTGVARNQSGVAARAVNVNNVNNVNGIATANPNAAGVGGATATLNKAAGVPFQTVIAKSEQK